MKYSCDMITDLLPLYHDNACSPSSRAIVEEHLSECSSCRSILVKMEDSAIDRSLKKEKENVIGHYARQMKQKLASMVIGIISILTIVICMITNFATSQTLDWFYIVLTSLLVLAALTIVPLLAPKEKGLWTLGAFTLSLLLLLLACQTYSGGNWLSVTFSSVLLGLSVFFLPYVLHRLPLKGFLSQNKGLLAMLVDTVLVYHLITVCGFYAGSYVYWKSAYLITSGSMLLPWTLFAVIRYLRANSLIKWGICVLAVSYFSALFHDFVEWILSGRLRLSFLHVNFLVWNQEGMIDANIYFLMILLGTLAGLILLASGAAKERKK